MSSLSDKFKTISREASPNQNYFDKLTPNGIVSSEQKAVNEKQDMIK